MKNDSYETILYEKSAAILKITLNRPDTYNAFTEVMHRDLKRAFTEAAKDDGVRVVILTGAGRAFCAGQDLKEIQGMTRNIGESVRKNYNPNILRIRKLEKPVICAMNGVAAGAGMSLALACDVRIASDAASMMQAFINVALIPDSGSTWFLPRLAGYHRAFELCSTGRKINMDEALRLNLVDQAVPADQLETTVQKLAQRYTQAPPKALGMLKRALNRAATATLDEALEYEAYLQEILGGKEDYQEGVAAFVEKRKPNFQGK
jgi:2-(1,2-epoxy-1,2-dihydrophenyl)acetyl-CoA isomerase